MTTPPLRLHLVDIDRAVADALAQAFALHTDVDVQCCDILSVAHDTIVSPANSHGFMDGGVDAVYRRFFGNQLEATVRRRIARRPGGLLPIGAAEIVDTGHPQIQRLVVAPTMEMPEQVSADNAYRALRAALRTIRASDLPIADVYCPGLCTLVGGVAAHEAAEQMAQAYADWSATLRSSQ